MSISSFGFLIILLMANLVLENGGVVWRWTVGLLLILKIGISVLGYGADGLSLGKTRDWLSCWLRAIVPHLLRRLPFRILMPSLLNDRGNLILRILKCQVLPCPSHWSVRGWCGPLHSLDLAFLGGDRFSLGGGLYLHGCSNLSMITTTLLWINLLGCTDCWLRLRVILIGGVGVLVGSARLLLISRVQCESEALATLIVSRGLWYLLL